MKKTLLSFLIFLTYLSGFSQNQQEIERKTRENIYTEYEKVFNECHSTKQAVTDLNGMLETWKICELNNNRIIKIAFHKDSIYHEELYFEKNGELIYAKEIGNYLPLNHFTQKFWNCEFYIKNRQIISIMSLGHGDTEDDGWDPESIIEMYDTRLIQLKEIKN